MLLGRGGVESDFMFLNSLPPFGPLTLQGRCCAKLVLANIAVAMGALSEFWTWTATKPSSINEFIHGHYEDGVGVLNDERLSAYYSHLTIMKHELHES